MWPFSGSATWVPTPSPIYPVAAQWSDSLENTPQVINSITAIRVNSHGRLFVNVPAGTTSLTAWLANNVINATFDVSVGVYVDGVYTASWNPGAGSSIALTPFTLSLDGAAHTVVIWSGYSHLLTGTYVYAIQGVGISLGTAPTVTRRLVAYGDSITEGGNSVPSAQKSWFALLRAIYPGAISQEAFGARRLWDDSGTGSGQLGFASVTLLAQRLVGLCFGVATREIWLSIGINDEISAIWPTVGDFQADYSALLDAIHTADAGVRIYAQAMFTNQGAWTTAIQTAAAGRSYCTYVDGSTMLTAAGFLGGDGVHPNNDGYQAIALGTGPAASTTSMRAVLGI